MQFVEKYRKKYKNLEKITILSVKFQFFSEFFRNLALVFAPKAAFWLKLKFLSCSITCKKLHLGINGDKK